MEEPGEVPQVGREKVSRLLERMMPHNNPGYNELPAQATRRTKASVDEISY